MKRTIAVLGLAAVLSYGFSASAAPTQQLRDEIQVMLGAPEYTPSKAEWLALGPDAATVLREVAQNRKLLALKRGRAISALSYFNTSATETVLTGLIGSSQEGWLLRGKAARAYALGFGAKSLPVVKALLSNQQKRLREAAIRALANVPVLESRQILEAHLRTETLKHLRAVTELSLRRVDARMLELREQRLKLEGGQQ